MKRLLLLTTLLALPCGFWLTPCSAGEMPFVIFEDDFDSDSDGPMALCLLLELEAAGECKIIACGTSELHEDSTSTMAATLHYFGRGDVPLGSYRDDLWPYDPDKTQLYDPSLFCETMAADGFNYGHTRRHRRDYPDAVEVYVKALNALPDGAKAKIIVAGGQTNLRTFLEQHPQLVRDRVSELHFMGGMIHPDDPEEKWQMDSNVSNTDALASKYVAENWPHDIPFYIADTYLGLQVPFCRPALRTQLSDLHPAKRIHLLYRLGWDVPHGNALDLMSVIAAVRGFTNLNSVDLILQRGTLEVNGQPGKDWGKHRFISSPDGPHTLLRRPLDSDTANKLADYIDDILLLSGGDAGDGVFRDEFVAERGSNKSETLQTRRGWIKAGAADSSTLIDASGPLHDEKARYVQFNGNSGTSPFNVQVKDFGSNDIRVRARVLVTQSGGYIGLCVRSDAADNARGLNLRIQPGRPGLRLYENDTPIAGQRRTIGTATAWALNGWYVIELEVQGTVLVGRLYDDYTEAKVLEEVQATLVSVAQRTFAGLIAHDTLERADWFQSGVRQPGA
jgi:inosine-uridine nucleoside N-ribohydrolase